MGEEGGNIDTKNNTLLPPPPHFIPFFSSIFKANFGSGNARLPRRARRPCLSVYIYLNAHKQSKTNCDPQKHTRGKQKQQSFITENRLPSLCTKARISFRPDNCLADIYYVSDLEINATVSRAYVCL